MEADVLIIGGGAAGTVAALLLAKAGKHCIILEKNGQIGRKLRITGKGRCNLTNACDLDTLMANVPRNPKFLYSAFARWMPEDVMAYFEQLGVPLKVERGNRVFPVSDRAEDIVAALQRALKRAGIPFIGKPCSNCSCKKAAVLAYRLPPASSMLQIVCCWQLVGHPIRQRGLRGTAIRWQSRQGIQLCHRCQHLFRWKCRRNGAVT